ncbi:MAG: excinuclease ABC subunit UvrB [Anaerolineales bacterium]|nr:excinuclease ABC subunit UvrB [Anaerolineales bacterium]
MTQVGPIGQLVDAALAEQSDHIARTGDTEVLDMAEGETRYSAQAFDPATGAVALFPIRSLIRHDAPAEMYTVETACGRGATLTGDHNLWVLRDGELQLIETTQARTTDYVPLPETLLGEGALAEFDTLEALADSRLYVDASASILAHVAAHGPSPMAEALAATGVAQPYGKLWAMRHQARGRGLTVEAFTQLIAQAPESLAGWEPANASVGGKRAHNRLPARLPITNGVLQLVGYYLAEGNHQRGYIILANRALRIRAEIEAALGELGLPFAVRPNSDYQVSSTALADLLGNLCGATAGEKHLPGFWADLPNDRLAILLRAYFDGDGTVGRSSDVSATTASAALASDLAYALLRFGLWARISRKWKRATNSASPGDWYYQVMVSGQADLRRFAAQIGFGLERKQTALAAQWAAREHSNVDVVPGVGGQLRRLRRGLGLSAEALASATGLSRSAIQFFENGQRAPRRANLKRLLAALRTAAADAGLSDADWHTQWAKLDGLTQVRWTRVVSVQSQAYAHPHVYDFCVPGPETFLGGHGGLFVHNTFTIANVVVQTQRPTLVMAHNKTLAAQLYAEFKEFFPRNAVEYFVSYYDYYQPEAYVARHDLYIEKETQINDEIDRLRLAASAALLARRDVLIVASVSCIYGLGSPDAWRKYMVHLKTGETFRRNALLRQLVTIQYQRNDVELKTGLFRVRGDTLEIMPIGHSNGFRIAFFGDEVERIVEYDTLTGELYGEVQQLDIFPAKHFITEEEKLKAAIHDIEQELEERVAYFKQNDLLLEAQRIEQRTRYDLEMLREVGYCSGIENYSRPLDQRAPGSPPTTLIDYFPPDFLLVLDESHMTVPQIGGMFGGDRSRKEELVKYGFRLPSALDNRPLSFDEFEQRMGQVIYTSATPGPYEMGRAAQLVEQIIRPTGLVDPEVEVRPTQGQIDNLIGEIQARLARGERTLVTTLTKRMAEDLSDYLLELGTKVTYLHSEIDTLERVEILRDLRLGVYDVVVGINLLREGLDLPEVSLVAILDADKEGFLRSGTSLVQTIGRAARHVHGKVLMYADKVTDSMRHAIDETNRRRAIQVAHNEAHGIVPAGIVKSVRDLTARLHAVAEDRAAYQTGTPAQLPKDELSRLVKDLEKQMKEAAQALEFEKAALLRDQVFELRQALVEKEPNLKEWEKAQKLAELEADQ